MILCSIREWGSCPIGVVGIRGALSSDGFTSVDKEDGLFADGGCPIAGWGNRGLVRGGVWVEMVCVVVVMWGVCVKV